MTFRTCSAKHVKLQRVRLPPDGRASWLVLDDMYQPVRPIQAFVVYMTQIERSPHTVRAYAHHLRLYWAYLIEVGVNWTTVGLNELARFISWLRAPREQVVSFNGPAVRRGESTINLALTAVAMFYDYHARVGTVADLPLYRSQAWPSHRYKGFLHHLARNSPVRTRVLKLKAPRRQARTLSAEDVAKVVAACRNRRDKFLVSLLYETGMRIGQALGLRHEDIQSWDNVIRIVPRDNNSNGARAKTRDPYIVHVSRELMGLYTDYLVHEFDDTASDYVFVNLWEGEHGRPLSYGAVADLFRRLSRASSVGIHPHLLRHTHATDLLRSGWDAAHVGKRLGHAQIQTTLNIYTHLTDDDLKSAYRTYLEKSTSHAANSGC
jgi:site-specific recombinase XerD